MRTIVMSVQRYQTTGQKCLFSVHDIVGVDSMGPILAHHASSKIKRSSADSPCRAIIPEASSSANATQGDCSCCWCVAAAALLWHTHALRTTAMFAFVGIGIGMPEGQTPASSSRGRISTSTPSSSVRWPCTLCHYCLRLAILVAWLEVFDYTLTCTHLLHCKAGMGLEQAAW